MAAFAVKAALEAPRARTFAFDACKVMYGGKQVRVGDEIYVFDSENEGGNGLVARGVVDRVAHVRPPKIRHTPRVSFTVKRTALARRPLGRAELKAWRNVQDGSPEAELDFKLYRQATNKLIGISDEATRLLRTFF